MNDAVRFWVRVNKSETCWEWIGAKVPLGYGTFVAGSKRDGSNRFWRAHRYSYTVAYGPIPVGMVIDHLCRNPCCVRPDHLEAVTQRENLMRGVGASARNAVKTHCPSGHPYDAENTARTPKGRRYCKACNRRKAAHYKKLARERKRQSVAQ